MAYVEIDILNPENNEEKKEEPTTPKVERPLPERRLRTLVISITGEVVEVDSVT